MINKKLVNIFNSRKLVFIFGGIILGYILSQIISGAVIGGILGVVLDYIS